MIITTIDSKLPWQVLVIDCYEIAGFDSRVEAEFFAQEMSRPRMFNAASVVNKQITENSCVYMMMTHYVCGDLMYKCKRENCRLVPAVGF